MKHFLSSLLSVSFFLPASFSHAQSELSGIYQGKEWGLFHWGEPCEVRVHYVYRSMYPELSYYAVQVVLSQSAQDSQDGNSNIVDVALNFFDAARVNELITNSKTQTYNFEYNSKEVFTPKTGGKLAFVNGKLIQAYVWNSYLLQFSETATCGVLKKEANLKDIVID